MFFRLLVFLSFLFAFDADGAKFFDKLERGLQKADRFITEFNYAIGATPNLQQQTQSTFQQQHIDSYLDYTPEYHGIVEPRIEEDWYDDIRFHPIKDEIVEAYARSGLSGKALERTKQEISCIFNDEEILEIDAWLFFALAKIECDQDGYDDLLFDEYEEDRSIPKEYEKRISWRDKRQLDLVGNQKDFPLINGIMRRATFLRYDIEKFREENPAKYQKIISLIETYYTGILLNNVRVVLASAAETGGTTLVAAAATCAVFSGIEALVNNVLEKGGDELSWHAARKDKSLYASYLKTCDFFVDFVANYGLTGAIAKKLPISKALALSKQQNLLSRRVVKDTYVSKSVTHKGQTGTSEKSKSVKQFMPLDFVGSRTNGIPAYKHIEIEHSQFNPAKVKNGVFYGAPKQKIELAWRKAHELGIEPVTKIDYKGRGFDHYVVPFSNAGYEYSGGTVSLASKTGGTHPVFPNTNCDYITIVVEKGTNRLKDAYPSSRRPLLHGEKWDDEL